MQTFRCRARNVPYAVGDGFPRIFNANAITMLALATFCLHPTIAISRPNLR